MGDISFEDFWLSSPSPDLSTSPPEKGGTANDDEWSFLASLEPSAPISRNFFQTPNENSLSSIDQGFVDLFHEEGIADSRNEPDTSTSATNDQAPSTELTEKGVSLREWINGALDSIDLTSHCEKEASFAAAFGCNPSSWPPDVRKALALLSEPFLNSALQVAYSLADHLVKIEREKCHFPDASPTPGSNWAEHAIVYLVPPPEISRNLSPFPNIVSSQQEQFPTDGRILDVFDVFETHHLEDEKKGSEVEERMTNVCESSGPNYLHVSRAEISQPFDNTEAFGKCEDEKTRLYSLGLVFYELFSGGRTPPELSAAKSSKPDCQREKEDGSQFNDDSFEPLPVSHDGSLDLTSALDLLGDLESDETNFDCARTVKKARAPQNDENITGEKMIPVSVEPLKLQRLPNSLCDLIHNMVDCARGDLRGDESYSHMHDVRADLCLMLEKPDKFFRDLDIIKISASGLQLNEDLFGREAEYSTLAGAHGRSIAGENEMAIILGPSGTGKSMLANRLSQAVTTNGGMFLSGKFDQQVQPKPLSAIATAFNEYCDLLVQYKGLAQTEVVASRLKETFGQEIFSLMKIIPNVGKIINQEVYPSIQQNSVDATSRLHYLLCQFMAVICSASSAPVTLFLDDLQWADSASVSVVVELMLMSGSSQNQSQFFFLGCCRDDNITEGHPVKAILSGIQNFRIRTTTIRLSCFEKDVINTMVSDLLCLSPRLTRSLSELVYYKTKGNPLFFSNLMVSLSKEGVLRINLARRRWEWDEAMIQSRSLPDDVALFFTSMIGKLPNEVQSAMSVLACFGASTDCSLVKQLEEKLGLQLLLPLEIAVTEGFLVKSNGEFRFSHDRVQEASYNLIDPSIRPSVHFKYGLALSSGIEETENSPYLFSSVGQLNRGGPAAVADESQSIVVAKLNQMAGDQAIEMSDFSSAFFFFEHGISFLPENHWNCHYKTSLHLYDGAVKCSLVIANFAALKLLSKQVMIHAKSFEDKLNALYIAICSLAYTSKQLQLIEKGKYILSQLGEDLPETFVVADFDHQLKQTKEMLSRFTMDSLMNYQSMTNFSKIMAMKFLSKLLVAYVQLKPDLQPFVTLKMVQLTLVHGVSPMSPLGFAYYGSLLGRLGNIQEGYHYTKVAKDLLQKIGAKEVSGPLYVITTQVMFAVEPMQAANEYLIVGRDLALSVGDMENAMLSSSLNVCNEFWIGTKLQTVNNKIDDVGNLMKRNNHSSWLTNIIRFKKTILMLIGRSDNRDGSSQTESVFVENKDEFAVEVLSKNPYMKMLSLFHDMYTAFMFRKYDDMKHYAEEYFKIKKQWWILYFNSLVHNFVDGLASFWIYRKSGDALWLQRGRESILEVRRWAETSEWNYLNMLRLLEAEEHFCNKNFGLALSSYKDAIVLARDHRFIHEEALAYELAGNFLSGNNEESASARYLTKASQKYDEWGAFAKAIDVRRYITQEVSLMSLGSSSNFSLLDPRRASLTASDPGLRATSYGERGTEILPTRSQKRTSSLL